MLSSDDRTFLATFLAARARPEGTLDLQQAQGLLFAVTCAPEPVPTSDWIAAIFNGAEPGFADVDESRRLFEALVALYNEVNEGVVEGHPRLPADCAFHADLPANCTDDAPVARWAQGFVLAQDWLAEAWDAWLPEALADDFDADCQVLGFFASAEGVRADLARTRRRGDKPVEALYAVEAEYAYDAFDAALTAHAEMGRKLYRFAQAMEAQREPVRVTRTGRNEPCPCGSGRKYKKCCGA